jgi:hypothetical protein
MAIETREQVYERVINMTKPKCPHCDQEMSLYEVPPLTFSDGLGWGVPYLFVCFNDQCPLFMQGWDHIQESYAHNASYRCMNYPGTEQFECMPVFSEMGGRGQIIDDQAVAEHEAVQEAVKQGFSILAECFVSRDGPAVLNILTDASWPNRVRIKAAEMIGDIGELEAIEPIRNLRFGNRPLQEEVDKAVQKIHARFFTRECPYCAEIIKQRAKVCKHCGKDVTGR